MTPELHWRNNETYRRRRAVLAAAVLSFFGVVALTVRESGPHPGQIAMPLLVGIGIVVYVAPFALSVDRGMRRGRTDMPAIALVGTAGIIFLATRSVGSFSQVWPAFTAIVSITLLHAIDYVRTWIADSVAAGGSG
ncbi:MAG: hypothetical protein ABI706_11330 [Ilumatobacteraceae bacterium]